MGIYTTTYIFFGCPITVKYERLKEKLSALSADEKINKNIISIDLDTNYLIANDAVFMIVPRTKKQVHYQINNNDKANGYVKISDIEKEDELVPLSEEYDLFFRYIDALVKEDKKDQMKKKIGYYIAQFEFSTYDVNDMGLSLMRLLSIDMTK